jgi:serine protease Do
LASSIWTSAPGTRREIWHQNSPVTNSEDKLAAHLAGKFGDPVAALFAIPRRNRDGSVEWADRLGAEKTSPIHGLPAGEKAVASATLREMLQKVETACDGSPEGQRLLAALNVDHADAIRVANGRPIIAGWGAIPPAFTTPEQLASHHAATLGPFLSRVEPPRFWIKSVETVSHAGRFYGSWGLLAAVVIAAIVLLWLLLPGVLRDSLPGVANIALSESNRSVERQIEVVRRSLEQNVCVATQIPRLELPPASRIPGAGSGTTPVPNATPPAPVPPTGGAATVPQGAPKGGGQPGSVEPSPSVGGSTAPPTSSPGGGAATPSSPSGGGGDATPGGAGPPKAGEKSSGASPVAPSGTPRQSESATTQPQRTAQPSPPVDPNSAPVPAQVNPATDTSTLATLLKKSTVIVVTKSGTGSGFFVSGNHVLTNRHVVEDADSRLLVGNQALGQLVQAEIVGESNSTEFGAPDFALLKLKSGQSSSFLSFSDSLPVELENVIATGYPGFVISGDESYRKMRNGDIHSVPPTALSSGAVTYIQNPTSRSPVILHYATISPGNSGGPLTDECGRVVGVNTFVSSNDGPNARMNYSLSSSSAIQFLKGFNVAPNIVPGVCTTAVAGRPAAPPNPDGARREQTADNPGASSPGNTSPPAKK